MSAAESPSGADQVASSAARRKSGRVSKKPARFAPGASPTGSTKRKRGDDNDSGVDATEPPSEEESEESSEGEPDEEELRERRRRKKRKNREAEEDLDEDDLDLIGIERPEREDESAV